MFVGEEAVGHRAKTARPRRMGPRFRGDDIEPIAHRSSSLRDAPHAPATTVGCLIFHFWSSPRTRGPITTDVGWRRSRWLPCQNVRPRRMGPCFRRDDLDYIV